MNCKLVSMVEITIVALNTPQRIFPASAAIPRVISMVIRAPAGNTSNCYVGDSSIAFTGNNRGLEVAKGGSTNIAVEAGHTGGAMLMAAEALFLVGTAGDKVNIVYFTIV